MHRDVPALASLVLIDCPDPDTTEEPDAAGTNLARLRQLLPHCDVLLVTTTQQKYRSARVGDELATAASGARLVFVQTHADVDQDIRQDWRKVLGDHYAIGHIFLVDSLSALADAQNGLEPRGEFAALVDLLTRQLAGAAAARIRRANLVDLAEETLTACRQRIDARLPDVQQLLGAIEKQRGRLASRLAAQMRSELLASRRQWEGRLLGQIASRWGFSPFAMVLRLYQGLGWLVSGALLMRARTPAQVALWGAVQGARTWRRHRRQRAAESSTARAAAQAWQEADLRSTALVIEGYAAQCGLDRQASRFEALSDEAAEAVGAFGLKVAGQVDALVSRVAERHAGFFTRLRYELLLLAILGVILFRLGKNFFYDSWLAPSPVPPLGLDFYFAAAFWILLWCLVLLWAFTSRLRRGLRRQIDALAETWNTPESVSGMFGLLERECQRIQRFRQELERLEQQTALLRRRLATPDDLLGHRR